MHDKCVSCKLSKGLPEKGMTGCRDCLQKADQAAHGAAGQNRTGGADMIIKALDDILLLAEMSSEQAKTGQTPEHEPPGPAICS